MSTSIKYTHTEFNIPDGFITSTLILPCCWVCRRKFIDSEGTDPSVVREEHHPVPRAYGGLNGPTVSLCTGHHSMLHKIADGMISEENPSHINIKAAFEDVTTKEAARLIYLARVVYRAWYATKDDPNKKGLVQINLVGSHRRKLEQLCKFRSLSREDLIAELIDVAFANYFPT